MSVTIQISATLRTYCQIGTAELKSSAASVRDAMDIDHLKSPSLYFGTTTGQLWIGRDGGEQWNCLFDALPPIRCVKVAVV